VDADALLDGLNEAQARAVRSTAQPLRILAGAGSGKTRVLTRRIAHRAATGSLEPRHVLAVTFTRKAAGELNHRLRSLGLRDTVAAGTFHSVAYAALRARWSDRNIRPPALLDRKVGFVARILPPALARRGVSALDVVSEIEWAKARLVAPDDYADAAREAKRRVAVDLATVAEVFDRYEAAKRDRRMVDFDDLLRLCRRDLLQDAEFAAAQRWRFRHFFVDEYQDVNPSQHALLAAWLGDRHDLCVVGDPNQAIYAWNGADASYLQRFERDHPGSETVHLDRNYRSSPQIIAVANRVLGARGGGLVATRPEGPVPDVLSHADDRAEARAVARAIRDAHAPGRAWSDQAVLVRTHAQTALIEEALHEAGIPFRVRGGSGLLDRPEVKQAVRDFGRGRSFADAVADLGEAASAAGDTDRATNLAALLRLTSDYRSIDPDPTPAGFLAWLTDTTAEQPDAEGDAVELATFHAAKGLEWPIVHLAGLEQGLVPISYARTREAMAEERRLLYVAMTRAQRALHLTWAEQRTFGERKMSREPSLYLEDVEDACAKLRDPERAARSAPPKGRRNNGKPTSGSDEVLVALKAWRSAMARRAAVPAYVIFHDRTLEAVAAARPSTHDQLLALPGLGPVKVNRYGDELLDVVASHGAGA
jgi:DNA helicase-2/ATP-dependent DNA helicase PcrA